MVVIPGPAGNRGIVDAELAEAVKSTNKRQRYDAATLKVVTDCARQIGPTKAGQKHVEVPVTTSEQWLAYWRKHNKYYVPGDAKAVTLKDSRLVFTGPIGMGTVGQEKDYFTTSWL